MSNFLPAHPLIWGVDVMASGFSAGMILGWPWMLVLLPEHREEKNCKATGPFIKLVFKEKKAQKYVHIGISWGLDKTISTWLCEAGMQSIHRSPAPLSLCKAGQRELMFAQLLWGSGDLRSSLNQSIKFILWASPWPPSRTVHFIVILFKDWTQKAFCLILRYQEIDEADRPYFLSAEVSWTLNCITCVSDVLGGVLSPPLELSGWPQRYLEKSTSLIE